MEWKLSFARAWVANRDKPVIHRIAESLYQAWSTVPLDIPEGQGFPGRPLPWMPVGYASGSGVYLDSGLLDALIAELPELSEEAATIRGAFDGAVTQHLIWSGYSDEERNAANNNVFWAGGWGGHIVLDYARLLTLGTSGLRAYIDECRNRALESGNPGRPGFYEAELRMCDTIEMLASRYSALAREKGMDGVASILDRVPKSPCRTWEEALHAFWLVFAMDNTDSPGRFDQYMWPYYSRELDNGNRDGAFALLERLWLYFEAVRAWNICVGGVDAQGNDASNELSLDVLRLAAKYKHVAPNLTLRVHPGTPGEVWRLAGEALSKGHGVPAIYNDEVVVPALTKHGIPLEHARNYCMNGCNQFDIHGMSHMGLEDGELSLIKCLELALNDGMDPLKGIQVGPNTGCPETFRSMDDLIDAFKAQVAHFAQVLTRVANRSQEAYSKTGPDPLRSLLIQGCLEKGLDTRSGGPLYNHGQVLLEGIGNTADSLAVIGEIVFNRGLATLPELVGILRNDWVGHEDLRAVALGAPKYGNDDDRVDRYAVMAVDHAMLELKRHRTFRGGVYGGGCSVFTRGPIFGANVGATPDGRRARAPLADSVGPVQGKDTSGPTSAMNSAAKPDATLAVSGYVLNIKFTKDIAEGAGPDKLVGLIKGYFASGGQQVQVTVADADELRRAQSDPDSHRNIIVRVGGFSDYFVNLGRDLQDEIISRTAHD